MDTKTRQIAVPLWRYTCPECGVGDQETGHFGADHAIYCEICLEDGEPIRLRRWQEA